MKAECRDCKSAAVCTPVGREAFLKDVANYCPTCKRFYLKLGGGTPRFITLRCAAYTLTTERRNCCCGCDIGNKGTMGPAGPHGHLF